MNLTIIITKDLASRIQDRAISTTAQVCILHQVHMFPKGLLRLRAEGSNQDSVSHLDISLLQI
jgi:hypothetical protein